MILEKSFELTRPGKAQDLLRPDKIFAGIPVFDQLGLERGLLAGTLVAQAPLFGQVRFPFESRLAQVGAGDDGPGLKVQLSAQALDPVPSFWAELSGHGSVTEESLLYQVHLKLHVDLPEGEKWGGRALRRMAEASFERTLARTLLNLG
ncbi:MAG: DUF3809 domain-containing protein [Deinococcus sp.]|nr:DUF3809 domain-containing protein [Deinococcus sp.]